MRLAPAKQYDRVMVTEWLYRAGLRASHAQLLSMGSVGLCIALWIRAKTVDQDERGNAERRALFVGLWPPLIWLMGNSLGFEEPSKPFALGGLRKK